MKRKVAWLLTAVMITGLSTPFYSVQNVKGASSVSGNSIFEGDVELGVTEAYFPVLEYNFNEEFVPGIAKDNVEGEDAYLSEGAVYVQDEAYGQVLYLDGGTEVGGHNSFLEFPEGFFDGMDEMTISMDVKEVTRRGNYFTFALGQDNQKYLFLKTDPTHMKLAITDSGSSGEQIAETSFVYPNNSRTWIHVTMVVRPDRISLYQDGRLIAENETEVAVSDLGDDLKAYLGRSFYSADKYFRGYFDNVTVFDYAMGADEVASYASYSEKICQAALSDVNYVADSFEIPNADNIQGNITLPSEINGVQITWESSDESVISTKVSENKGYDATPAGVVTRGDTDVLVKLRATFTMADEAKVANGTTAEAAGAAAEAEGTTSEAAGAAAVAEGSASVTKSYPVVVKAAVPDVAEEDFAGYLFVRFTGSEQNSSQEQTYFSISRDGLHWQDLNDGQPVLTSVLGESGLRDHYIGRSAEGDKFYMIATDLSIYHGNAAWMEAGSNGSHSIVVWESEDLVNWSEPWLAEIAPEGAGCTWAPEFIYDDKTGEYIVYWSATTLEVDDDKHVTQEYENHTIYYAKTRDFRTFTDAEVYHSGGKRADGTPVKVIDSTMIEHDGIYYRYTKNEMNGTIMIDESDAVLGGFTDIPSETLSTTLKNRQGAVEGPIIFKMNGLNEDGGEQWCLMVDRYGKGQGYYPLITTDLASGEFELLDDSEFSFPSKYRHGYVLPVTLEEYNRLQMKWGEEDYFDTYLLEAAIREAKALKAENYTADSYEVLAAQIKKAEEALGTVKSMEELEAEIQKLQEAAAQLQAPVSSLQVLPPDKTVYQAGEELDLTGLVVTAVYPDGSVKEIREGYQVSGYSSQTAGTQAVLITYEGKTAGFTVTVEAVAEILELPYEDVIETDWFYEAVACMYHKDIMTGMKDKIFAPYEILPRAQFAAILFRMEGAQAVPYDDVFTDVPEGEWYTDAVVWAAGKGIIKGYADGCFGPDDLVTREQMAVMMHRYAEYLGKDAAADGDYSGFEDAAGVSLYAESSMKWAVGKGIITGKDHGRIIDPLGNTTRSEAAAIIQRFLQ